MRTARPQRLEGFDYLGPYAYFLTFCVFERRPVFVTPGHVEAVLTQILRAAAEEAFAVIAYCFMPDHLHLLVRGETDVSNCRRFIALAKQLSGYHFQRAFGARLWQRYGYERTLRSDEATLPVVRYIIENPVRAGIVTCPSEYPFLGSTEYSMAAILDAVQLAPGWRDGRGSG